jgi:hypothetical protein
MEAGHGRAWLAWMAWSSQPKQNKIKQNKTKQTRLEVQRAVLLSISSSSFLPFPEARPMSRRTLPSPRKELMDYHFYGRPARRGVSGRSGWVNFGKTGIQLDRGQVTLTLLDTTLHFALSLFLTASVRYSTYSVLGTHQHHRFPSHPTTLSSKLCQGQANPFTRLRLMHVSLF